MNNEFSGLEIDAVAAEFLISCSLLNIFGKAQVISWYIIFLETVYLLTGAVYVVKLL